jgi:hypothetical protein
MYWDDEVFIDEHQGGKNEYRAEKKRERYKK